MMDLIIYNDIGDIVFSDPEGPGHGHADGQIIMNGVMPGTTLIISAEVDQRWSTHVVPDVIFYDSRAPGVQENFDVFITAPPGTTARTVGVLTVTAEVTSLYLPKLTDSGVVNLTVAFVPDLVVDFDRTSYDARIGGEVEVKVEMLNRCNAECIVTIYANPPFGEPEKNLKVLTIPRGEIKEVVLTLDVPGNLSEGKHNLTLLFLTGASGTRAYFSEATVEVSVEKGHGLVIGASIFIILAAIIVALMLLFPGKRRRLVGTLRRRFLRLARKTTV